MENQIYLPSVTLTEKIFQHTAPYNNPYQGDAKRLLFVCSAGLLRSPTGANQSGTRGFNTRSCGSNQAYALVNLSVNLILWAHRIVFVNFENFKQAIDTFAPVDYESTIKEKSIVLDIPDNFEYNNPILIKHFERQLDPKLQEIGYI